MWYVIPRRFLNIFKHLKILKSAPRKNKEHKNTMGYPQRPKIEIRMTPITTREIFRTQQKKWSIILYIYIYVSV